MRLGFCYMNCGDTEVRIYAWSLLMGLLLQSLTVLPSHCNCGMFLRVTWRVDFTGDLAELEESMWSSMWVQKAYPVGRCSMDHGDNLVLNPLPVVMSKTLANHFGITPQLTAYWLPTADPFGSLSLVQPNLGSLRNVQSSSQPLFFFFYDTYAHSNLFFLFPGCFWAYYRVVRCAYRRVQPPPYVHRWTSIPGHRQSLSPTGLRSLGAAPDCLRGDCGLRLSR